MLTLSQQVVIDAFARELVEMIRNVIKTRPIERVSLRNQNGKQTTRRFSAPVNASGNLAATLRYELTETNLSIYANDYIYKLIWGEPPNENNKVSNDEIKAWFKSKGIEPEGDMSEDTLASLVVNKIKKHGSSIYLSHQGKNSGLLENIVNESLITEYNNKFTAQLKEEFILIANGN